MTVKPKAKRGPGNPYPESIKREAKRLYLAEGLPDTEIARRLGVSRDNTVREWRRKGDWEGLRQAAAEQAAVKTIERLADREVEENERAFKQAGNLQTLVDVWIAGHRQEDGKLAEPDAKELNFISHAMLAIQKSKRLAMGLPDRITESRGKPLVGPDLSKLSDEELVARVAAAAKHRGNGVDKGNGKAEYGAPTNGSGRIIN